MNGNLSKENVEKKNSILEEMHSNFLHISDREGIQRFSAEFIKFCREMRIAENTSFLRSRLASFEMDFDVLTRNNNAEEIGKIRAGMQELRKIIEE